MVPSSADGETTAAAPCASRPTTPDGPRPTTVAPCTVRYRMNAHDAMTLESRAGHRTFQVVDYAHTKVCDSLAQLSTEDLVCVRLEPIHARGNLWRAVEVL